jgi:ABC-type multidrug transport system permease subunit
MKAFKILVIAFIIAIFFVIAGYTIPAVKDFVKEGVGKMLFQLCYGTLIIFCFYSLFIFGKARPPF